MSEKDILIRISNAEMMGRVAERERIIKLLEEQRIDLMAQGGMTEAITMGSAIALIKGENK